MPERKPSTPKTLALIKQAVTLLHARYEFSSYVEYLGGCEIGKFTKSEIERTAQRFLPVFERHSEQWASAEQLREFLLDECLVHVRLNTGASILGFCAVTPGFIESVRLIPEDNYWAVWFCIEILQHSTVNDVPLKGGILDVLDNDSRHLVVPTGEIITYRTLPMSVERETHLPIRGVIELLAVQSEDLAKHAH